ncbi:iron-sulfur cluster assembly scaffold protein [Salidesulfovibrio onnuriiensis]|uniref:iron-sulfur cluster assembly scaffold protein n=1 Tax=Salidesulfovibrio onnuriiensis TaxID=2583823 RepID=UPI0011C9B2D0|nr:iron-sulfur cluster assembly scaffold protein [Salidesulfovibrio onnuriiensis]
MNDLDQFVTNLQDNLNTQARETYGDAAFERWRNPPNHGMPAGANGHGVSTGSCGDTIEIFLKIENDTVQDSGFLTDGCASSIISGSMAAELALNKGCEDLTSITGEKVLEALGGNLGNDAHCAWLAANALHDAVGDYFRSILHPNANSASRETP